MLCDTGLPGMDGYAVARALRLERALDDTFLVALSGYGLPEDQRRAAHAGFDAHLTEPATVERVEEAIGRVRPARPPDDAAAP